jgi:hypothetical protein
MIVNRTAKEIVKHRSSFFFLFCVDDEIKNKKGRSKIIL